MLIPLLEGFPDHNLRPDGHPCFQFQFIVSPHYDRNGDLSAWKVTRTQCTGLSGRFETRELRSTKGMGCKVPTQQRWWLPTIRPECGTLFQYDGGWVSGWLGVGGFRSQPPLTTLGLCWRQGNFLTLFFFVGPGGGFKTPLPPPSVGGYGVLKTGPTL